MGGKEWAGEKKADYWGVKALAASMPYNDLFAGRRERAYRETLYTPLWLSYFESDSLSTRDYADDAHDHIIRNGTGVPDYEGLAAHEKLLSSGDAFVDSFSAMITLNAGGLGNSGVRRGWNAFIRGLRAFEELMRPGNCLAPDRFEKAFDAVQQFWGQSLYVRAAGAFLLERAERGGLLEEITRSFTVTFGEDEVVTLGQSM